MILEAILIFILIRHLRKSLRNVSPNDEWDKYLSISLYAVVVLCILQEALKITAVTMWIWLLLFIGIVAITLKLPEFEGSRTMVVIISPLLALSLLSSLVEKVSPGFYEKIDNYFTIAFAIAVTWLLTMLIRTKKQRKALEDQQKKTREEEERSRYIARQKAELEVLVAERTAEIMSQKNELQEALTELRSTQKQLIQSEKMASLGELTAGIAHEIQNPLNFVNNFSEINTELIEEMQQEINKGNLTGINALADNIKDNEQKIIYHGKRADAIVKSMLQHSRNNTGAKEPTDINALADEFLRLAYHGLRAKDKSFNATIKTDFDKSLQKINVIPQDIGRVFLNLFSNAFYSVAEKNFTRSPDSKESTPAATIPSPDYKPTVAVTTKNLNDAVEIRVKDNGMGVPSQVLDKIYQPFFTTKPTGQGTGLGLSLSYDIIKTHGGDISVETNEGEGAEFTVRLPAG